ncbi:MAG: hypothetical protein WBG30_01760 [Psychrilyobacter sp.]|uniref:hypothetical protein n=1 Tax=Psychrilyobacter sp. TaxID=2586924 RepID=UPI003C743FA6
MTKKELKKMIKEELRQIENEIEKLSKEQLKNSVIRYSAEHLGDNKYHPETLKDEESDIPFIKSVCGSALNVLTQDNEVSEEVLEKADRIISLVYNDGFNIYKKRDLRMVYIYFRAHRIYHQENK